MRISLKAWLVFIVCALLGVAAWAKLVYPQLCVLNLAIDRKEAFSRAELYLRSVGVDPRAFVRTAVFESDEWADRYLQKTIGPLAEDSFLRQHRYELFSWNIRFFKPLQKEEYYVAVSPSTGKITGFDHLIDDIAEIPSIAKDAARRKAEEFLVRTFALNVQEYDFHEEKVKRFEKRTDYVFSWEKKGVYIPWGREEGGAKLLVGVRVSGDQISAFSDHSFEIPEKFRRYCQKELAQGGSLNTLNTILLIVLTGVSSFLLFRMRQHPAMRSCMRWYMAVAFFLIFVRALSLANGVPEMLNAYPTSIGFVSFSTTYIFNSLIVLAFFALMCVMPALAGESLRRECFPGKPALSFGHYLLSSFYTRLVAGDIVFGYTIFCITLGLQAVLLHLGQNYAGVWKEWDRVAQFSSAYIPFVSIFAVSINASFSEEITYRLFGITACTRYFKKPLLAVVLTSVAWGLGHSMYPIFPIWYRVVEVSTIGVMYGIIFLRFGIIPLIIAHYLVNIFWGAMAYLFGNVGGGLFYSSVLLLLLPCAFACVAYVANNKEKESSAREMLNSTQRYNVGILIPFIALKKSQGSTAAKIAEELVANQWDRDLIDLAILEVFKS